MNDFVKCLSRVRRAWQGAGSPRRLLIALSGGVDSVALFALLRKLAEEEHLFLACVHVHHGLRDTADKDADFCRHLCEKYGIPFRLKKVQPASASENDARSARYAAFADVYHAIRADAIALAHHRSDQAETMLLHLFRGAGSRGLCGMHPFACHNVHGISMQLFRPLLDVDKAALQRIVENEGCGFCADETNASDIYLRNFLRLQILPKVLQRIPKAEEALGKTASILQAENDWMDGEADTFLQKNACLLPPLHYVDHTSFAALHVALRRRVMQNFIPIETDFDELCSAADIQPDQVVNLKHGYRLIAENSRIYLLPQVLTPPPIPSLQVQETGGRHGDGKYCQSISRTLYEACEMRYRKEGDYIQPFGMQGKKSLQDYLVDRKIDAPVRDHLPLLCMENEVIWVIGVGASEKVRQKSNSEEIMLVYPERLPFGRRWKGE